MFLIRVEVNEPSACSLDAVLLFASSCLCIFSLALLFVFRRHSLCVCISFSSSLIFMLFRSWFVHRFYVFRKEKSSVCWFCQCTSFSCMVLVYSHTTDGANVETSIGRKVEKSAV